VRHRVRAPVAMNGQNKRVKRTASQTGATAIVQGDKKKKNTKLKTKDNRNRGERVSFVPLIQSSQLKRKKALDRTLGVTAVDSAPTILGGAERRAQSTGGGMRAASYNNQGRRGRG